ncbi:hypothetical protein F4808DRAFT_71269 [Astrocystis sublimbata]|nr:hypothetical protein F4808DRAFT_71269 [Astrocystis sublimbata]
MPPFPPALPALLSAPTLPRLSRHPLPSPQTLNARIYDGATTVPQGYGNAPFGPDSGTVAGIVLGSVAGFLLVLGAIYWCINLGQGPRMREEGSVGGGNTSIVSWRSRSRGPPRSHGHRRSRRSPRREKVEIRRQRSVPVQRAREVEDQIVVEEFGPTRRRSRSRPRSVSRGPRPPPPPQDSVLSEGDDMIVVEEERPEPRRSRGNSTRNSTRSRRTRSRDRRSAYREEVFVRDVSRTRSRSRM